MMQLQTVFVEYNKEMQKKQNELTQPIFQKAMGLIRRLATQKGLDMIVDKQAVPYVRSDLDMTDQLITLYNSGGVAPAAEPKASTPAPQGAAPATAAKK
jgi:outer membrane protein